MMDVYHGIPYNNVVPVLARSTVNGTVSVSVNGQTFTATADTSVNDGLVLVNVTGLDADKKYQAVVTTPNENEVITLRTLPEKGEVRFGWHSCGNNNNKHALWQMIKRDVHCCANIGDEFYGEAANSSFGMNVVDCTDSSANASSLRNWYDRYIHTRRNPELKVIVTSRGYAHMGDDHEWAINDIRWDITNFQTVAPWVTSTADMQMIVENGSKAAWEYNKINPPNPDQNTDINPFYTRFTVGPHLEVFMITSVCAGYNTNDPQRLVRNATGDMLTALEEAWLLNALANSDRTFKLILSPKMTFTAQFYQDDFGRDGREVQRDRICAAIHAASGWKVPGGVFWGSGDFHTPSVHALYAGIGGATYDHVNVCACPAGQDNTNIRNAGTLGAYTRKHFDDLSGTAGTSTKPEGRYLRNVGIVTIPESGSYAQIEIVLSGGQTWWSGRVNAGENKLSYPKPKIAIG